MAPVLLGIDTRQWRALVLAGLRRDLRRSGSSLGLGGQGRSGRRSVVSFLALNGILGAVMAVVVWQLPDLRLATLVFLSFLAFNIGSAVVLDFHGIVLAPEDHDVLGYQPVSPRTFAAARLASLLTYVLAMGGALAVLPAAAYTVRAPWSIARGATALAAALCLAATVALAAALAYAVVLRITPAGRLRSALTTLQLFVSFVVYGTAVLLPSLIGREQLLLVRVAPSPSLLLFPPSWWASWIDLSDGARDAMAWVGAALSVAACAAFLVQAVRMLSLDEADRLASLATTSTPAAAVSRKRAPWLAGESLAVDVLARAQFRHDLRFRLSVLAIVPLTLVYLLSGVLDDQPHGANPAPLVTIAVLLFPSLLQRAFVFSGDYRAAWVFYATPVRGASLVLALRSLIVRRFLGPYLAFVALLLALVAHDLARLGVMLVLLALGSHAILLAVMIASPGLPFSQPPERSGQSQRTLGLFALMGVVMGLAQGGLSLALASPLTMSAAFAIAAILNVALEATLRRRVDALMARVEFSG